MALIADGPQGPVAIAGEHNAPSVSVGLVDFTPSKCITDSRYVAIGDAVSGGMTDALRENEVKRIAGWVSDYMT